MQQYTGGGPAGCADLRQQVAEGDSWRRRWQKMRRRWRGLREAKATVCDTEKQRLCSVTREKPGERRRHHHRDVTARELCGTCGPVNPVSQPVPPGSEQKNSPQPRHFPADLPAPSVVMGHRARPIRATVSAALPLVWYGP